MIMTLFILMYKIYSHKRAVLFSKIEQSTIISRLDVYYHDFLKGLKISIL
jgi:hypothetical protein